MEINTKGAEFEQGIYTALQMYSNVHRGSGHFSMVSTHLYEQARRIVLEYLGLNKKEYTVIFCSHRRAAAIKVQLEAGSYRLITSKDIGLSLGVAALAVKRKDLPKGPPFQTGGGTAKLVSGTWEIWAGIPDRFEAGTPAIINVIAFASALGTIRKKGKDYFLNPSPIKLTAHEILYQDELEKFKGKDLLEKLKVLLIGSGLQVPTMEGIKPFINLDNSASTPTFTPIWNAFRHALNQADPVKLEIIRETRAICAKSLNAAENDYDIHFTSNTTEAINLVAESLNHEYEKGIEPVILNSLLEHSSNDLPWRMLSGFSLVRLPVDDEGFMDLLQLEKLLAEYNREEKFGKKRIKLVAVSGASNVLGVCNGLEEISSIVHSFGARLLVDAAQLIAHRKVDMEACGIDYLAFSAHKVYAPFGCGVLVARKGMLKFTTAEFELIRSSGEENTGGIAALGKSLLLLQRIGMDTIHSEEQALTRYLLKELKQVPGLTIYGMKEPDSTQFDHKIGVVVFTLGKMMSNRTARELSLQSGIGVRFGCHCAHIIVKRILKVSPGLERFQKMIQILFPKMRLPGVVRVSLGLYNTPEDVDNLIRAVRKIAEKNIPAEKSHPVLPKARVEKQIADFIHTAEMKVYS
jgi:selenocysteine lyase/cysteine desulfurase